MAALRYEIFHSLAALTHEIFFNTQREISYLRTAIIISSIGQNWSHKICKLSENPS